MNIFGAQEIVGTYDVNSNTPASYDSSINSAIRIKFAAKENNLVNVTSVQFCVIVAESVKILAGTYTTITGLQNTFVQIPLLGQPLSKLAEQLNNIFAVNAEIVNNNYNLSCLLLQETALTDVLDKYIYLNADLSNTLLSRSEIKNSLVLFYTSVESFATQNNYQQSYGGFLSTNPVFLGYPIQENMGLYENKIILNTAINRNELPNETLFDYEYVKINDEIMKIAAWQNNTATVAERGLFGTQPRVHAAGSIVSKYDKNIIFDSNIDSERKQYRCFAIKNTHPTYTFRDIQINSNLYNRNINSNFRIAIEIPKSNTFTGVASSDGITAFSVDSLKNFKNIDHYKNAPLKFTSGLNINQVRIVKSYVPSTGTLELMERLPFNIKIGDSFKIDPQSSIRMKTPYIKPTGDMISQFMEISGIVEGMSLQNIEIGKNNSYMEPNEVFYLWLERSISPQSEEFHNNRLAINLSYSII